MSANDTKPSSTANLRKEMNIDSESTEEFSEEVEKESAYLSYPELQKKLTETEERANQYFEKLLRLQADMENNARRSEREIAKTLTYALEKFALDLLPVIDNLERAVSSRGEGDIDSVLEGVNLTLKLFQKALDEQPVNFFQSNGHLSN